jgi:uncharacterized protein (DUF488 family)
LILNPESLALYTIGHSNHPFERFAELLRRHRIEAVADVRSMPASRRHPQYNRERLRAALSDQGIDYLFLGKELGARRTEPEAYAGSLASYERIAGLAAFRSGLDIVKENAAERRVALMCAEKEPLDCHRTLLVCRHLRASIEGGIFHILADGSLAAHAEVEERLVAGLDADAAQPDLFAGAAPLERAYRERGAALAYRRKDAAGDDRE